MPVVTNINDGGVSGTVTANASNQVDLRLDLAGEQVVTGLGQSSPITLVAGLSTTDFLILRQVSTGANTISGNVFSVRDTSTGTGTATTSAAHVLIERAFVMSSLGDTWTITGPLVQVLNTAPILTNGTVVNNATVVDIQQNFTTSTGLGLRVSTGAMTQASYIGASVDLTSGADVTSQTAMYATITQNVARTTATAAYGYAVAITGHASDTSAATYFGFSCDAPTTNGGAADYFAYGVSTGYNIALYAESGALEFANYSPTFRTTQTTTAAGPDFAFVAANGNTTGAGGGFTFTTGNAAGGVSAAGGDFVLALGTGISGGQQGALRMSGANDDVRWKMQGTGVFRIEDSATTDALTFDYASSNGLISATAGTMTLTATGVILATGTNLRTVNGLGFRLQSIAEATTLNEYSAFVLVDATTAGFIVTLPAASALAGQFIHIKKTNATNTVTISRAGTDTIQGDTTLALAGLYDSITIFSNGSNLWFRVATTPL